MEVENHGILLLLLFLNIQTIYGIDLTNFLRLPEASFLDIETNPGPRRPVPAGSILRSNMLTGEDG